MKTLAISILLVSCGMISSVADSADIKNQEESNDQELTQSDRNLVSRFFYEVILGRDLSAANEYFMDLSDAKVLPKVFGVNEYTVTRNYQFRKREFISDCSSLMDMLPREAEGNMAIILSDMARVPRSDGVGYYIRVSCVYDLSGSRFEFVTPLVIDGGEGHRIFASRFYKLLTY